MTKRILALITALCMVFGMIPAVFAAEAVSGTCGADMTWTFEPDTGTLTIAGTGRMETETAAPWSEYMPQVTTLIIGEGITALSENAFHCEIGSSVMASVTLPSTLTSIPRRAFYGCAVEEIALPEGLTFIGDSAFYHSGLREVIIPDSVTHIGEQAFSHCYNLQAVTLPFSLETMKRGAFSGCKVLTTVEMPYFPFTETIEGNLFGSCSSLTDVSWFNLTTIPADTFHSTGIEELVLHAQVSVIGDHAFENCDQMTTATFHEGIEEIGIQAFRGCDNLNTVYFQGDRPSFISGCFEDVTATIYYPADNASWTEQPLPSLGGELTWIAQGGGDPDPTEPEPTEPEPTEPEPSEPTKPSKPEGDPDESGTWGDNLTWELHGTTLYISGEGEMAPEFNPDNRYPWMIYQDMITDVVIDEGIINVANSAFSFFPQLVTAHLPDSITLIDEAAFLECENLESINVPANLTELGYRCFANCRKLTDFPLPAGLTAMSNSVFSGTAVTHVVIPEGITSIGAATFSYCASLESIVIPNSVTSIGHDAFMHCTSLKTIDLPDRLTSIESRVFSRSGLTSIEIPVGVTTISNWAFMDCTNLESVTLPECLTEIYDDAFAGCASLTYVDLPDGLTHLGSGAFEGSGLIHVEIPDSIIFIQDSTFRDCTALNAVTFPGMLESIGTEAFYNCSSLTVVELPNTVVAIQSGSFADCEELYAILIPDSVASIHETALLNCPDLRIHCYNLSYAHLYALAYEIPVEIMNEVPGTPLYNTLISCGPGGSAIVEPDPSPANRYVLIEVQPDSGYVLESLWYEVAGNPDQEVYFEQISDTVIAFFMPASDLYLDIYFVSQESPFTDVKESDYFFAPVLWAVSRGITTGMGNGRFAPNDSCTRAQVVTFLWRAAGEPEPMSGSNPFTDVKPSDYFYKAVLWAVENGITTGMSATSFGPGRPCTRGQVVTFLYRAAGGTGSYEGYNPFTDVKSSDYYYDAVLWAVENGITTGMSADKFGPNSTCTRGQVVTFLFRFLY